MNKSNKIGIYALLLIPVILSILALCHFGFFFKSGSAGSGILILIILYFRELRQSKGVWAIVGAFLFSVAGDWFLSNRHGQTEMFVAGIALFFLAHVGYLTYALMNGRFNRIFTVILMTGYLLFFFIWLYPSIKDQTLMVASLLYLLISCFSLGAAVGIKADPVVRWAFITGIFLILFSDTIIAFKEFAHYKHLNFLILPTYYAAHIMITFSLIRRHLLTQLAVRNRQFSV
jgi:uncharacterized membrane protein YhhN